MLPWPWCCKCLELAAWPWQGQWCLYRVRGWRGRGMVPAPPGTGLEKALGGDRGSVAAQGGIALYFSCIFSRMGTIMSNLGRLAGSSFMQIFISLQMCGEMPGGMVGRSPSRATLRRGRGAGSQIQACVGWAEPTPLGWGVVMGSLPVGLAALPKGFLAYPCPLSNPLLTFMPISMLDKSAKGTSRVTSSHSSTAKLHMSAERLLISSGFFCRAAENPVQGWMGPALGQQPLHAPLQARGIVVGNCSWENNRGY